MPEKEKKSKPSKGAGGSGDPPLTAVERLQSLNLVSRVASEWHNHLGLSDRTLAEFVMACAATLRVPLPLFLDLTIPPPSPTRRG